MIARAKLKYLGVSSQKTRLVVDQVRGQSVENALDILRHSPKLVSGALEKLLKSALANAQQSDATVDVDSLFVARAIVDEAPVVRRSRHQSMGRVFPVLKRACHVTFDLDVPAKPGRG